MIRTLALFGLACCVTCSTSAQTTLHYREGQRVDPQEVAHILDNAAGAGGKTRSIRLLGDEPAPAAAADAPTALSLPIHFDLDSTAISASARGQLDALAAGIKLLPPDRPVVIEGHTDARGSGDYNDQLSMRRAEVVKLYLVRTHGIDAQRLQDVGFGKRQPIEGSDPYAAENRRVEFHGG